MKKDGKEAKVRAKPYKHKTHNARMCQVDGCVHPASCRGRGKRSCPHEVRCCNLLPGHQNAATCTAPTSEEHGGQKKKKKHKTFRAFFDNKK